MPAECVETEALVYGGWLAVHKTLAGPYRPPLPCYAVTHLPTSGWVVEFRHQRFAKKCAAELAETIAPFEDNPGEGVLRTIAGICGRWLDIEADELHKEG